MSPIEKTQFAKELIEILNMQYPDYHFDGYVQIFIDQALERSGFALVPHLAKKLTEIRDLARTGLPPIALGMTSERWANHRLNKISAELTKLIESVTQ